MKKIKSVIKIIMKKILCPVLLWVLMVVIFQKCLAYIGIFSGEKYAGFLLFIECKNIPEETAYVDILVKIDHEDPDYVHFTKPPKRFERKYIDENGNGKYEYLELPITVDDEIAKWNEDGYVSLTLHHKDIEELRIGGPYNYKKEGESDSSINEMMEVEGYFFEDFYEKYGDVRVAYVNEDGKVLKVTDSSKKKYMGYDQDRLVVDGDSVFFEIGTAAPWVVGLFFVLVILVPLYTIWLIVKMIKFLCKGF